MARVNKDVSLMTDVSRLLVAVISKMLIKKNCYLVIKAFMFESCQSHFVFLNLKLTPNFGCEII
jgi:hypothetical protein